MLDRIFDGFCHMPGMSVEQVGEEMIVIAKQVQNALAESKKIQHSPRGVFVLALQQVVDSWIAGLITEEPFEWLAERQKIVDQCCLTAQNSAARTFFLDSLKIRIFGYFGVR